MHPKRLILSVLCVLALLVPLTACGEPQARVTTLPDDSAAGYVTVMAHSDWATRPGEKALIEQWESLPEVVALQSQSHYLFYVESDAMYQHRLKHYNPILPAIMVQHADGRIAFKDHGDAMPSGVDVDVAVERQRHQRPVLFPWNKRALVVTPEPGPKPDINTNVVVAPQPIPDKVSINKPNETAGSAAVTWAIIGMVVLVVAVVTFAVQFHKRVARVK